MRRALSLAAKITLSALLLWWAQSRFASDGLLTALSGMSPGLFAAAIGIQAALTLLLTARWSLAARLLGSRLPKLASWQLVWVGQFFNQTLPSSLGGDAYRIWATSTRLGFSFGFASTSVIVDRLLALLAIPFIAVAGLWLVPEFTRQGDVAPLLWPAVGAIAFAATVLARLDAVPVSWRRLAPKVFATAERFSLALRRAIRKRRLVLAGLLLSVVIHGGVALSVYVIACAVGLDAALIHFVAITPLVLVVAMIPVTISGWGLREGAMVVAFGALGYDTSLVFATSVAFGLAMMVIGVPGGLIWVLQDAGARPLQRHLQEERGATTER